jgi:hypothetical protein
LGIPPFPPDGPPPAEVQVRPPDDLAAAYAQLGADLPGEAIVVGEPRPGVPVWAVRIGGEASLDWWERLRSLHPRTGLWPVLFWWPVDGPLLDASIWETTALGDYYDDDVMVDVAVTFDAGAWLTDHEELEVSLATMRRSALAPADPDLADWRTCFHDVNPDAPDAVALIPAVGGWAVPAVLNWWGGANAHVDPLGHSAVLRRWAAAWGAELVLLDSATMMLRVERPPSDDLALQQLAAEAWVHCPYVYGSYGNPQTLEELAHLMRRPVWDFWWD